MNSRRLIPSTQDQGQAMLPGETAVPEEGVDVRFGSKADICSAPTHVRFAPESDIKCNIMECPLPKADRRWTTLTRSAVLAGACDSIRLFFCRTDSRSSRSTVM